MCRSCSPIRAFIFSFSTPALLLVLFVAQPSNAQVVINEFVPANTDGLLDEDSDTSDWIELVNLGTEPVDLTGWGLSDNPAIPLKWQFPQYHISPGEHLLIFASAKDRQSANFWHTIVNRGDLFRYRANETAPPADWHLPAFDDSAWPEGPSGFGYSDNDDNTILPSCQSASLRHNFMIENLSETSLLVLHIDYDDGFVAWINGQEIIRENLPPIEDLQWDTLPGTSHEAQMYHGSQPNRYVFKTSELPLQQGTNLLSIEVHNVSNITDDLSLIPFLTLGLASEPAGGASVSSEIDDQFPILHTNFKLSASGEDVVLTNNYFANQDAINYGPMVADFSLGRHPDGLGPWLLMSETTPGQANSETAYSGFAEAPAVDLPGGFYSGPVVVQITPPVSGGEVRFSLNSDEPDEADNLLDGSITISETTVLRTRTLATGLFPSTIVTNTYIIDDPSELPATCLVTEPLNLHDRDIGIFVEANIWEDWERPMHIELFETDGTTALKQDAGVQLFGGGSRLNAQKSLRLIARSGYGDDTFSHSVFDERPLNEYNQLVFRNSGSEWRHTMMRDGLMHRLISHTDVDHLAWRPNRIYLNGQYWGMLHAREHVDADYIAANNGVDANNMDLIKDHDEVKAGDITHFENMMDFVRYNWLGNGDNFAWMETQMDMENFINYNVFEIFLGNTDWPGQNIACWRPRTEQGRWRWIFYDLDFGLGLYEDYNHDTLEFALSYSYDEWPNPAHSTLLLRRLMVNSQFSHQFINSYCDHLNTTFLAHRTEGIRQEVLAAIEPEIVRHRDKWEHSPMFWDYTMGVVQEYLQMRPASAREHLREKFELQDDVTLSLSMSPPHAGSIRLSAVTIDTTFTGTYFRNHSLSITAVPASGYVFSGWANPERPQVPVLDLAMADNENLVAVFIEAPPEGTVVINEICYNASASWNTDDWIELHNPGQNPVDISLWKFRDSSDSHLYTLPDSQILPAGGFAVLCRNTTLLQYYHPEVTPLAGNFDFGLSGSGEALRLFDAQDNLMDTVVYDDQSPWPPEADGWGPTLELIDPWLDNALAESWVASEGYGSPGASNSELSAADGFPEILQVDLFQPHPNPFNPLTHISFTLDAARRVDVAVFDLAGRRVRTLAGGSFTAGLHHLTWNGKNDHGKGVSSGVYFVGMKSGDFQATRKVMLLK